MSAFLLNLSVFNIDMVEEEDTDTYGTRGILQPHWLHSGISQGNGFDTVGLCVIN